MKFECKNKYKMGYSFFGKNMKLKINECFNLAQNNITEYFKKFDGDNLFIRENYNAVWVASKTRIHVFKNAHWLETLNAESFTTLVKPIRIEMETKFTNQDNELVFVASQQSCLLDMDTRKIRKIDTVNFPKDMDVEATLFENGYQKLNDEFNEEDFVYEQTVFSQDIDFSNHINNAVYVRYIMNALPIELLDRIDITDVEIHYLAEGKEGQKLRIYRKDIDDKTIRFLIKENDRELIRASIDYK